MVAGSILVKKESAGLGVWYIVQKRGDSHGWVGRRFDSCKKREKWMEVVYSAKNEEILMDGSVAGSILVKKRVQVSECGI
ncbi:MAG: hypothetical protein EBU84_15640 [Actinobacteria bacterium]|nr:hypothetical protein [Actinomycetota bacterium]